MNRTFTKKKMSKILIFHYWKLFFRSVLFVAAGITYVYNRINGTGAIFGDIREKPLLLNAIWLIFAVEMGLRFVPSRLESMGCQKQFTRNYQATGADISEAELTPAKRTAAVAIAWFLLNGLIGLLYFMNIIDAGILLLISLAYSVCDMICILFFCPFQTWFMKNRCCTTCRIYNWDFAMMFTPLIFVRSAYTWSLVAISLALLITWEVLLHTHPERFSEKTNKNVSCAMCEEKLCHYKKQLLRFWKENKRKFS